MQLFCIGPFLQASVLQAVLGREVSENLMVAETLSGFALARADRMGWPALYPMSEGQVRGQLFSEATPEDWANISFYADVLGLQRKEVGQSTAGSMVCVAPSSLDIAETGEQVAMSAEDIDLAVEIAEEIMLYASNTPANHVARQLPRIQARAASRVRGMNSKHGAHTSAGPIEQLSRKRAHGGFFAFDQIGMTHQTFRGGMSEPVAREVFVGTDAAILLPYDPVRDRVMLVEQVRWGPWIRKDKTPWLLEPIAGLVDPGETPEACALREAQEEAGLAVNSLHAVSECYASPGAVSDFFYIYVGLCDLPDGVTGLGGLDGEGEDIRSHVFSFSDVMEMAERMEVAVAPLEVALYWLSYHRDRLRAGG